MHLKSLTLKGFKSFASATTLAFEPGICAVVGPNGSGKSNVVDALSWVMGEQGAKTLRGGKMEDVIFAGTSGRAPLGRAEVTLTIDNSDGALPIDYAEVSITRRMFRDGASEYEINGDRCRLMDVQELLSDSGIGREMHVIVGQGKLAEILEARPEERRAFIEEAAGVLKHRRRKEKAQRKIVAMQTNVDRLSDLTSELRRQLKPLARQAEVARRAQTVQAELRDAALRLVANDYFTRKHELTSRSEAEAIAAAKHAELTQRLTGLESRGTGLETEVAALTAERDEVHAQWYRLATLRERVGATIRIAQDRSKSARLSLDTADSGPDPEELAELAFEAREEEAELSESVEATTEALEAAADAVTTSERHYRQAEAAYQAALRADADKREDRASLSGKVNTLAATIAAHVADIDRLNTEIAAARDDAAELSARHDAEVFALTELEGNEERLDGISASLEEERERAEARFSAADHAFGEHERGLARLTAQIEAWEAALPSADGVQWLRGSGVTGILGQLRDVTTVKPGFETAIAAVLGDAAEGVLVESTAAGSAALEALRTQQQGHTFAAVKTADFSPFRLDISLPKTHRWALDVIECEAPWAAALTSLLADVAVTESPAAAAKLTASEPRLRVVTTAGDLYGHGWMSGGQRGGHTGMELAARIAQARADREELQDQGPKLAANREGAAATREERRLAAEEALAALAHSDAQIEATTAALARLGHERRKVNYRVEHLLDQRTAAEARHEGATADLAVAHQRLAELDGDTAGEAESDTRDAEADLRRHVAREAWERARSHEMEVRLTLRTTEERRQAAAHKAEQLIREADERRRTLALVAARMQRQRELIEVAETVARIAGDLLEYVDAELSEAGEVRDGLNARLAESADALKLLTATVTATRAELAGLSDAAQREAIARAEAQVRIDQIEATLAEQYAIEPETLIAEYGPEVPVPAPAAEWQEYEAAKERGEDVTPPPPTPFERQEQEKRKKAAERDLATLGKVNPLALEEFAALEERFSFLSTQLADVLKARDDLRSVIEDVDRRIEQLFVEAWKDVEREFVEVFATLFPGGEGRLILTDPSDMLTTGIEVEARPPGKKVKRLSLLSGGEKSLTAVAMLVAIFRARPSPFYVMDEVEAALDDTNLRRLVHLFELLRDKSQLIVITHQKPTMDIADVLYGVSMRGDGITQVISQRMSRSEARQPTPQA